MFYYIASFTLSLYIRYYICDAVILLGALFEFLVEMCCTYFVTSQVQSQTLFVNEYIHGFLLVP